VLLGVVNHRPKSTDRPISVTSSVASGERAGGACRRLPKEQKLSQLRREALMFLRLGRRRSAALPSSWVHVAFPTVHLHSKYVRVLNNSCSAMRGIRRVDDRAAVVSDVCGSRPGHDGRGRSVRRVVVSCVPVGLGLRAPSEVIGLVADPPGRWNPTRDGGSCRLPGSAGDSTRPTRPGNTVWTAVWSDAGPDVPGFTEIGRGALGGPGRILRGPSRAPAPPVERARRPSAGSP